VSLGNCVPQPDHISSCSGLAYASGSLNNKARSDFVIDIYKPRLVATKCIHGIDQGAPSYLSAPHTLSNPSHL